MNIEDYWEKSLKHTEVIRPVVRNLGHTHSTQLQYLFLAESSVNPGDTVVRRGNVVVDKPALYLPSHSPQFEGFDWEKDLQLNPDSLINFLIVRGVSFPSLRFKHELSIVDLYEGSLSKATDHFKQQLERVEDTSTGLVLGPEDCWQFSILILVGFTLSRSAQSDLERLLEQYHRTDPPGTPS
ncbi:MAG: hypothetical protein JW937_09200 [Candidatus Omnitrophica bacterium]|nr:hypothetical protein [Candidatus Omnitrophota bacterium]